MFYVVPDVPALTVSSSDSRDPLRVAEGVMPAHANLDDNRGPVAREPYSIIVENTVTYSAHGLAAHCAGIQGNEVKGRDVRDTPVDMGGG